MLDMGDVARATPRRPGLGDLHVLIGDLVRPWNNPRIVRSKDGSSQRRRARLPLSFHKTAAQDVSPPRDTLSY